MTKKSVLEFIKYFLIALLITIPIKLYVAQPFLVSGDSMTPTFENGEYLIVDELSYHFRAPERGEVVIFRYPLDTSKFFIKRVIGLPNETITLNKGRVSITPQEGETITIDEPYVANTGISAITRTLGPHEYFVLGDNRLASSDSRVWGPVKDDLVIGRVYVRVLPLSDFALLPGHVLFE